MKLKYIWIASLVFFLGNLSGNAETRPDSLSFYLKEALQNNTDLRSSFLLYQTSLERVPQAGALADPELSFGFFLQPMEQTMGRQIGTIELMQMFPWFGTRKAARSEATEMARMEYEAFREKKAQVEEQVKQKWQEMLLLQAKIQYLQQQIALLHQIETIALQQLATGNGKSASSSLQGRKQLSSPNVSGMNTQNSMESMGGMARAQEAVNSGFPDDKMSSMGGSMKKMSGGESPLSDFLQIQLERLQIEEDLKTVMSQLVTEKMQFNVLRNRDLQTPLFLPENIAVGQSQWDAETFENLLLQNNPMLAMLRSEEKSIQYKQIMDRKMSLPMIGIGLEYMINGKTANSMDAMSRMNNSSMNGRDMMMPMIKISLPIFRKKYRAQQKENEFRINASRLQYKQAYQNLLTDFQVALQGLEEINRKLLLLDKQVEVTTSTLELATQQYTNGTVSLLEILQVERQLQDLNFNKKEYQIRYNQTLLKIEKMIVQNDKTNENE